MSNIKLNLLDVTINNKKPQAIPHRINLMTKEQKSLMI